MSTSFRATDLLAELPRLRRYARVLTGDSELADRLVEETLLRFRRTSVEPESSSARTLELMALLRSVVTESERSNVNYAPVGARSLFSDVHAAPAGVNVPRPAKWIQGQGAGARALPDRAVAMLTQLNELPPEQREVLVLVAVERLSYADVATLLRIPVATVVSRLSQAREALHHMTAKSQSAPNNAG